MKKNLIGIIKLLEFPSIAEYEQIGFFISSNRSREKNLHFILFLRRVDDDNFVECVCKLGKWREGEDSWSVLHIKVDLKGQCQMEIRDSLI